MAVRVAIGGRDMEYSGIYVHEGRIVVLRPGLSDRLKRCVLAHEAVHAEHGDIPRWDGAHHDADELRADIVMAKRLISRRQWHEVRHLGTSEACDRLNVVPHVLDVYKKYGDLLIPSKFGSMLAQ